jgi:hypothetical protein
MENTKEKIEKASQYYANNNFNMHETNSYKELKKGFEAGVEWVQKNNLIKVKETKHFTMEEVRKEYNSLTLKEKNIILYNAINYMQGYNGRTRFKCIALAMGYDNSKGENNTYFKN